MDSSREVANNLAVKSRYKKSSKILFFESNPYFSNGELVKFLQYKEHSIIKEQLRNNEDKIVSCIAGTDDEAIQIVKGHLQEDVINRYFQRISNNFRENVLSSCPLLGIHYALKEDDVKHAEDLLKSYALDLYPYIYLKIENHWNDAPKKRITRLQGISRLAFIYRNLSHFIRCIFKKYRNMERSRLDRYLHENIT